MTTAAAVIHPPTPWDLDDPEVLNRLRRKWSTVPAGNDRVSTTDLLALSDSELLSYWLDRRREATTGTAFAVRGWYHLLYRNILDGRRIIDVGAGLGLDALTFAQRGARMTLLDIAPDNLSLLRRLARLLGVEADTVLFDGVGSLDRLRGPFDVIWCQGSLINAPFDAVRAERAALLQSLPLGGRWIELCYPRQRWEREDRLPFDRWGEKTDGPGTPWVEWYDLDKLLAALAPARFDVVLSFNFHNDDFNWFDLLRTA